MSDLIGIRPFFTFYGGKWRSSHHYPAPLHDTIIEPFAGSAGYSVRNHTRKVILCDRDPVIVGVWQYLIAATADEILRLPDITFGTRTDDYSIPQEARWLIGFWLNKGCPYPGRTPAKWMRDDTRTRVYWGPQVRHLIANQLDAIRHWTIRHCSYLDLADRPATWFIDPPYNNRAGDEYRYGRRHIHYPELADWSRSRTGQVIVCENTGADWLPFTHLHEAKTLRSRSTREAVWLNTGAA